MEPLKKDVMELAMIYFFTVLIVLTWMSVKLVITIAMNFMVNASIGLSKKAYETQFTANNVYLDKYIQ